ncbi:YunG family protein [Cerasicoccus arenae]|uniref:Uncharacterized protein n=1 Tax=Cerasicoccus arenae TaxID=424488 RepID=A0A8J3GDQ5_9BACT|nr:hypothetical protein [Cerasicoccus arenae]MBK1857976.1 hypothetical protein [Cerasicoccus arenae]GHB97714.1 hypothetical protein GCM10007047_11970 [Cerasicoccus arenae]
MIEELTKSLTDLRATLERVWGPDTSTDPHGWNQDSPSKGQCTVTALLLQDMFGGIIVRSKVCGNSHFWNRLDDGCEIDLTRDQFAVWLLTSPVEERFRDYVLSTIREDGTSTLKRYDILRGRMESLVGGGLFSQDEEADAGGSLCR